MAGWTVIAVLIAWMAAPAAAAPAVADPHPEPDGPRVTFAEAIEASASHPAVRASQERLRMREELDARLGWLTSDPTLLVNPGVRFATPTSNGGFDGAASLQQGFALGRSSARREAAQAERTALARSVRVDQRTAERRAARTWLDAWAVGREVALRRRMVEEASRQLSAARRRAELGMAGRLEVAQRRAFLARTRIAVIDAEGRQFEQGIALAAACGLNLPSVFPQPELPSLEAPPSRTTEAGDDPAVMAVQADVLATRARTRELQAQAGWRLTGGIGVATEPPGDVIPALTLGVTVPVSGRNPRPSARSRADQAAAEVRVTAARQRWVRVYRLALHEVAHTREVLAQLEGELVPAHQEELASVTRAWDLGTVELPRVLSATLRLLDARIEREAARSRHVAAVYDAQRLFRREADR
jgi:outer membrane protein TolC